MFLARFNLTSTRLVILLPFISSRRSQSTSILTKVSKSFSLFFFFCWRYSLVLFLQYVSFRATLFDEVIIFFKNIYVYIYSTCYFVTNIIYGTMNIFNIFDTRELMLYLCNALSIVIHRNCVINFYYNAISIIRIEISDT